MDLTEQPRLLAMMKWKMTPNGDHKSHESVSRRRRQEAPKL